MGKKYTRLWRNSFFSKSTSKIITKSKLNKKWLFDVFDIFFPSPRWKYKNYKWKKYKSVKSTPTFRKKRVLELKRKLSISSNDDNKILTRLFGPVITKYKISEPKDSNKFDWDNRKQKDTFVSDIDDYFD